MLHMGAKKGEGGILCAGREGGRGRFWEGRI